MATKIEWTDEVWNPVTGCTKVSEGCTNCYAEANAKRFWGSRKFYDVYHHNDRLSIPLHWKNPRKVFVCSMGDLFHEKVSKSFIGLVFGHIKRCPQHIFQILTKRPERMKQFIESYYKECGFDVFKNVWLGVTCENQKTADERIPVLLQTPSQIWFLSIEPCLEDINISRFLDNRDCNTVGHCTFIDWVIVGCESGAKKRPCKLEWVKNIIAECKRQSVSVFVKQLNINGKVVKDINQFPPDLRIREYPKESNHENCIFKS